MKVWVVYGYDDGVDSVTVVGIFLSEDIAKVIEQTASYDHVQIQETEIEHEPF